ncbi:MAG: hypothetical protein FJY75_02950 [Candidatus Eisenbacteria bacterium]|uniref:DUF1460 domain-containing protein n=1 Tax=Eiseniibacteriota bacterium TaxID=2212470 RepID=A0A937X963_UNCEI|nr:hypothetical protein [Candidatus Eisenbacteria bacterium]
MTKGLGWAGIGLRAAVAVGLAAAFLAGAAGGAATEMEEDEARQERLMQLYDRMIRFNLEGVQTLPEKEIDERMGEFSGVEVGKRIADWAEYFWKRGVTTYRFGLKPGGYAAEGRLVDDFRTDCVLFVYRTTELGRSSSALEAVQFAFGTRFYGASLEEVVDEEGRVDYDSPVHLDYAEEMIGSGIWGRDITDSLSVTVADPAGTERYPAGELRYAPKNLLDLSGLMDGDIVWFVADERTEAGRSVRAAGTQIGHLGIVRRDPDGTKLIHAAASGLEGHYEGGKVEKVPLATYLARVETWKGLVVTRIENF